MEKTMDKIVALCNSRGFIHPGSQIYGGLANTWDYGWLGVELKNRRGRAKIEITAWKLTKQSSIQSDLKHQEKIEVDSSCSCGRTELNRWKEDYAKECTRGMPRHLPATKDGPSPESAVRGAKGL